MATVKIVKTDMSKTFPVWFRPEPGFKFRDEDGDPCLVLGWGGWRDIDLSWGSSVKFMPCGLLCAYYYKGEWHIGVLNPSDTVNIMLGWTPDQLEQLSGWE